MLTSFRVRDGIYFSVGLDSSSKSPLLDGSSWLGNIRADFGSAQNIQLLYGFFARTELLALAGVDSLVLFERKRNRGKTRSYSAVVRDFCSLFVRAHRRCQTVSQFICLLEIGFLPYLGFSSQAMLPVFLRCFANPLMLYLPQ